MSQPAPFPIPEPEPQPGPQQRFELNLEELYQIIGELEVIRRKQAQALASNGAGAK